MNLTNKAKRVFKSKMFSIWEILVDRQSRKFTSEYISLNEAEESVMVIPVNPDGKITLIKKYCAPLKKFEIVLPGGKIKNGETVKNTAARELIEEVGLNSKKFKVLTNLQILPQYLIGKTHILLAKVTYKDTKFKKEKYEIIEKLNWNIEKISSAIAKKVITDSRTISALLYYDKFYASSMSRKV